MPESTSLIIGDTSRPKVMVVSHERSGTHFLMNTLALNFGYSASPFWNLDFELGLNFHAPRGLENYFRTVHGQPVRNILKSHHQFEFFSPLIEYLTGQFRVFYIYRDPRDVMVSFWRMLQSLGWDEGPKTPTVGQFIRTPPCFNLLRYQKYQALNMLDRWRIHVEGWLNYAAGAGERRITLVRYEDLNLEFEKTVSEIAAALDVETGTWKRPDKDENVVVEGRGTVGQFESAFEPEDHGFVESTVAYLMRQLGYS